MPRPLAMYMKKNVTTSIQWMPCVGTYQAVRPRAMTGVPVMKAAFTQPIKCFFVREVSLSDMGYRRSPFTAPGGADASDSFHQIAHPARQRIRHEVNIPSHPRGFPD